MTAPSPAMVEAVQQRRAAGKSFAQIAAALGVSKGQVAGIVRRHLQAPMRVAAPQRPPYYLHSPGPGACNWVVSEGRPWRFCPEPRAGTCPYCERHQRMSSGGRSWQAVAA